MMRWIVQRAVLGVGFLLVGHGLAPSAVAAQGTQTPNKAPDALDLYFDNGSSEIRPEDRKLLDKACRRLDGSVKLTGIEFQAVASTGG